MATYIKTLKEDNGDVTYPQTVADAVRTTKGTTVQTELDQTVTAEDIAQTVTAEGSVTTNMIADGAVTPLKLDMSALLDLFYPVGCYFETSDTSFNPNSSWGGTWVEDTAGRVLVAQDSDTFATVGTTGGSETHSHKYGLRYYEFYGDISYDLYLKDYATGNYVAGTGSNVTGNVNNNTSTSAKSVSRPQRSVEVNTSSESSLQPYIVIKRWHRTA